MSPRGIFRTHWDMEMCYAVTCYFSWNCLSQCHPWNWSCDPLYEVFFFFLHMCKGPEFPNLHPSFKQLYSNSRNFARCCSFWSHCAYKTQTMVLEPPHEYFSIWNVNRIMKFKRKWLRNAKELEWRQTNKRKVKDIPGATSGGMVNKGKHVTPARLIISKYWRMNCLKLEKYCMGWEKKRITGIRCGSSAGWEGKTWLHFKNGEQCELMNIKQTCHLNSIMMNLHWATALVSHTADTK